MFSAAGILLRATDGRVLLLRRKGSPHAGHWAFPGGSREADETPEQTARRECLEETGFQCTGVLHPLADHQLDGDRTFTAFSSDLPTKIEPILNEEHDGFIWADPGSPPQPLHPGVANMLDLIARDLIAMDRASVRSYDINGRLHISRTPISKSNVCPYWGREIPGSEGLGLDPNKQYLMFRDPEELAKAAQTFNGIQILQKHVAVSAEDAQQWDVVGTTGTDAEFEEPYLYNSLVLWVKGAIDKVEDETQRELSCSYHYVADMTPGFYKGQQYQGVMREIKGNHVALVKAGRAGPDVIVGDAAMPLFAADRIIDRPLYAADRIVARDSHESLPELRKQLAEFEAKLRAAERAGSAAQVSNIKVDIRELKQEIADIEKYKAHKG